METTIDEDTGKDLSYQPDSQQKNSIANLEITRLQQETLTKTIELVAQDALGILSPKEIAERKNIAHHKIRIASDQEYRYFFRNQFGYDCSEKQLFETPAFVQSITPIDEEDDFGNVVIQERYCLHSEKEAAAILLHELTHLFGKPMVINKYAQPQYNVFDNPYFASTIQYTEYMGPLSVTRTDLISLGESNEPINRGHFRNMLVVDTNYEEGEWRLWEAITDRESTQLLQKIYPDYIAQTGYKERVLIDTLIIQLQQKGNSDITAALKKGLYQGDASEFKQIIEKYYGKEGYKEMRLLMAEAERINADPSLNNAQKNSLNETHVVKPFYQRFLKLSETFAINNANSNNR